MSKYDARLSSLASADVIARLEGQGGLLALSSLELFFLNDNSEQSARLALIKRIGVNKVSGNVDVVGDQGTLLEIPPSSFQKDELKLFLESLKGHVLRAKTIIEPPPAPVVAPVEPQPEPMPAFREPDPIPAPVFQSPEPAAPIAAPVQAGEPAPSSNPTPVPDFIVPPSSPTFGDTPINISEPPKTLPDDPDSIWAYEGQAKPVTATQEFPPKPPQVDTHSSQDVAPAVPVPMIPAMVARPSSTSRVVVPLLKIWAAITALFGVVFLGINVALPNPQSPVDPLIAAGVLVVCAALALIQWRLSES